MVTLRISQQNFTWKGEKTILLDNLSAVSCHGIQSNFGKIHSRCPVRQISSHSAFFFFLFLNQPEFLYLQQAKKAAEEYQKYFPLHLPPWNRNWEANLGKRRRKRSPPGSPLLWKRPWIYCTLAPAADADRRDRWKINTLRYKHLWRKKKKWHCWPDLPTVEKLLQSLRLRSVTQREIVACVVIVGPQQTSGGAWAGKWVQAENVPLRFPWKSRVYVRLISLWFLFDNKWLRLTTEHEWKRFYFVFSGIFYGKWNKKINKSEILPVYVNLWAQW